MTALEAVAQLHAASTLFLTGLIWFVQGVHYPLFRHTAGDGYAAFQHEHEKRTMRIVAPAMLAELGSAIALGALGWSALPRAALVAGLALLAVVWGSTFFLQVPCHRRLEAGFDIAAHRRLVSTNRVRTAAWTVRAFLALFLLARTAP
ncbi:hypothetical protein K8I85_05495 [bacterium]|nr:hypothetical protein [bacterium]